MVIVAAIVILSVTLVALQVDDWKRDLSTNHATTDVDSSNPNMRPLTTSLSLKESEEVVRRVARKLNRWQFVDASDTDDKKVVHLTRTSFLFRFVDDIHVTLSPAEEETLIELESQSRIGKGDLGQNPRNIQAFMKELRLLIEE